MTDLTIGDETFAVAVSGDPTRPALMLVHALGTDHRMWDGQIAALEKHFRLIRYDVRGHGATKLGPRPVSIDRLGRDAIAILDALDIPRAHVLGLSLGGVIGLWLMAHAPDRIERAIIASSAARIGTLDGWNARILSARTTGMGEIAKATLARWFGAAFADREPARLAPIDAMLEAMKPDDYAAICAALRDTDLRSAIHTIGHDVLVICGRDDQTVTRDDAERLAGALPAGRLVVLEARHLSNIEAASDFNAAVVAFLTTKRMPRVRPATAAASRAKTAAKSQVAGRGSASRRSNAARKPLAPTRATAGQAAAAASSEQAARRQPPSKQARSKRGAAKVVPKAASSRKGKALAVKTASRAAARTISAAKTAASKTVASKTALPKTAASKTAPQKTAASKKTARSHVVRKSGSAAAAATPPTRRKTPTRKVRGAVKPSAKKPLKKPTAKRSAPAKAFAKSLASTKAAPAPRRKAATKPRRPAGRRKP